MLKKFSRTGSFILSVGTIFSYILGAIRDLVFARFFGVSDLTDLYLSAFLLPDFLLALFITSALSGLCMPIFFQEKEKNEDFAQKIFGNFFSSLLLVFSFVLLLFAFFSPFLFSVFFPALFAKHPQELVFLGKCFLLTNFFFALSNFLGSFLMTQKKFVSTAFAPVFYNLGIILGIVFFASSSSDISAAAFGAVLGAFLHFLLRVFEYSFLEKKFPLVFPFWHATLKELLVSMPWKSGTLLLVPLLPFTISFLVIAQDGLFTSFQYFRNLQSAPIAIFAVSIATAAFPIFSQAIAEKNEKKFIEIFEEKLEKILFWAVPSSLGIIFLGQPFLTFLYGISSENQTFSWMHIFSLFLGITVLFESVFQLVSRAFFAGNNVKIPFLSGIFFLLVLVASMKTGEKIFHLDLALSIGIAYLLAYGTQSLFLFFHFHALHPTFSLQKVLFNTKKTTTISGILGVFFVFAHFFFPQNILFLCLQIAVASVIFFGFHFSKRIKMNLK